MTRPPPSDQLFRVLSDPTRRRLYERLLSEGELSVASLTSHANVSQPAVSKHLAALRAAGLVRDRPAGRLTYYSAEPHGLAPLIDWLDHYAAFWRERFDKLEDVLSRMDQ